MSYRWVWAVVFSTAQKAWANTAHRLSLMCKKVLKKVDHTRLPSVGFRSWSRFLAVSPQVTWVINQAVGCHYFPQACSYPRNPQEDCYQFCCLVNRGTMGVNSLPKTVIRQRRDCDSNPGPSAPESSTLTTSKSKRNIRSAREYSLPRRKNELIPQNYSEIRRYMCRYLHSQAC